MTGSRWFLQPETCHESAARVYCFPHAGGNPRLFLGWQDAMGDEAEVVAVCPPGRGHRYREPAATDVAELAEGAAAALADTADRPFVLFGHSFGAVLAFEVARRIRDLPHFRHLVASGCSAPALLPTERVMKTARLEGEEFTRAVGFFGGLPPEVVADAALQELLLPHLKADFRMVAGYTYRPADPLPVPVTLVNGRDDPHVREAGLGPWRRETTRGPAELWADGGHFYFDGSPTAVTDVLRPLVRGVCDPNPSAEQHVEVI